MTCNLHRVDSLWQDTADDGDGGAVDALFAHSRLLPWPKKQSTISIEKQRIVRNKLIGQVGISVTLKLVDFDLFYDTKLIWSAVAY